MEKLVKARKAHTCDNCDEIIQKNDKYIYSEHKGAKYKDSDIFNDDIQIGIEYSKYHLCLKCDKELSVANSERIMEAVCG